jgi:5-methylcytosine-specific restriction endonuclease McrA
VTGDNPRCPAHASAYRVAEREKYEDDWYRQPAWIRFRKWFLARHGLCIGCEAVGRAVAAFHVDHILNRRDYPDLALVEDNCRPLCAKCHAKRTLHGADMPIPDYAFAPEVRLAWKCLHHVDDETCWRCA